MKTPIPIKMSDANRSFLNRLAINEAYANKKERSMTYTQSLSLIEKYFKLNNDAYVEMISMGEKKNV